MRPTKRFEEWLSNPLLDGRAITSLQEYECEICGAEPMARWAEFICSVAQEGWGEYWRYRYHVCLDCFKAGIPSFPDRLRKHAQKLEERAQELRKLAADAEWQISVPPDAEVCPQEGAPNAEVCAQKGADDEDEIPF